MNPELLAEAEKLWNRDKKISRFQSRYHELPYREMDSLYMGMQLLGEQIPENPSPATKVELHEAELKRQIASRMTHMERFVYGKPYTLPEIITAYGLEASDLEDLRPWLLVHKDEVRDTLDGLFATAEVEEHEFAVSADIPRIRGEVEAFAAEKVTAYHRTLGEFIEGLTSAGNYLHRITSEPSTDRRSYFKSSVGRLGLSIQNICYEAEDGTIHLRDRELLRLFGHEGMGHALQDVISKAADLPFFLREASQATEASQEAVAMHFERQIFEDLNNSPETQAALGITQVFPAIYQEQQDIELINEYNLKLLRYSILVLADTSLGDPNDPEVVKRRLALLQDVANNPSFARERVEANRYGYDSDGNLDFNQMSELRYTSQATAHAFEIFNQHGIRYDNREGRSHIDMTFLTGFYTPKGFVQKAELAAQGKLSS